MCAKSFKDAIRENTDSGGIIHWENIELHRLYIKGKINIDKS